MNVWRAYDYIVAWRLTERAKNHVADTRRHIFHIFYSPKEFNVIIPYFCTFYLWHNRQRDGSASQTQIFARTNPPCTTVHGDVDNIAGEAKLQRNIVIMCEIYSASRADTASKKNNDRDLRLRRKTGSHSLDTATTTKVPSIDDANQRWRSALRSAQETIREE